MDNVVSVCVLAFSLWLYDFVRFSFLCSYRAYFFVVVLTERLRERCSERKKRINMNGSVCMDRSDLPHVMWHRATDWMGSLAHPCDSEITFYANVLQARLIFFAAAVATEFISKESLTLWAQSMCGAASFITADKVGKIYYYYAYTRSQVSFFLSFEYCISISMTYVIWGPFCLCFCGAASFQNSHTICALFLIKRKPYQLNA